MAFDPTKWIAEHDTATNKSAGFDPEAWIKEYDSKPAAGKTKVENQFDPEKWIADYDAGNNNKTAFSTAVDAVLKPFSVASDAAAIKQPKPRQPLELSLRAPVKADTERLAAAQEPSVFDYQINRIAENIAPAIERTSSIEELQKQQKKQNFLMRTAPAIATVGVGAMPLSIAAAYEALQQGRNFAVQKAKGEKYNPIDSRTFAEILPEGTPEAARIGTTMLEMLGDMALVGKGASLSKKVLLDDALRVAENKLLSAGYEIDDIARNSVRGKQFIKSNYKKITPEEALEINIRTRTAEIPKVNKEAPGTAPKPASISEPIRPAGSDITSRPQPQSTVSPDNTIQQPVSPVRSQNQPIQSAREIIQREERKEHLRQEIDYLTELMNTEDRIQQAAYDKLQINLNNVVTEYEQLNNPEGVEVAAQEEVVNIPTDNSSGRNNFRIYSENFENTIGGKIRIPEKGSVNRGEYDSLSPRIKRRFFTTNQNAITFDEAEQLLQESGRDIKIWDYLQNIERNTTKYRRAKVNISAKEDAEFAGAESGQYKDAATQWEKKGTDSPYFKKWFGDSKVVDNSGKPLVVYHGTDEVFNEFINRDILDLFGNTGFNFTDSKAIADTFSDIPTNTLAVYLDIKNPKVYERSDSIDAATAMRADILGDVKSGQTITKATNDFRERLIAEGFDGIILHDTVRDAKAAGVKTSNHFIVFDPSQIKSTNNQGTFDPENANIYYRKSDKKQLTEGIKANIEGIRQLNKELFGDDNLRIVRKIFAEDSQEALGRYRDGMIDIVEGQANPKETLYHEAVHKYADMFLTEDERKAIFAETLRKTGIRNQEKLEERVAEDFIEYANDRQGFTGRIKMLFEKLLDRIKAFFGKENKVRKMYNDILSGKAAKMQAGRARNLKAETESAFRDKEYNTVEKKLNYVIDDIKNKKTDINFSVKAGKVDIKIRNLVKKELGKDISEYVHKIYKNDLIHIKNRHIGGRQNDLTYNDLKLIPQIIKNYDAVSVDKNKTPPRLRYEKKYNDGSYFYVEQILGESKKELASKTMYKKEPPSERGTDTNIKSAPSSNGFRVAAEPTPNGGNKSITEKENDVKFRALPDPDKFKDSKIVNAVQRAIGSKQAQTFKIKQRWDNIVRGMQKQGITSYQDNVDLFNYYDNPKEYPLPADLKNKIGQDLLNEILNFKKMMTNEQVRRGLLENVWKDDAYMRRYIVNIDDTPLTALQLDKLKKSQPWSDRAETEPEAEQKIKDYRNEIKDLNEQLKNTQESDAAFSLKGKIKNRENQIEELNDLLKRYREQRNLSKRLSALTGGSLPAQVARRGGSSSASLSTKNKFDVHRLAQTADQADKAFKKLGMKINRNFIEVMSNMVSQAANITGNYDFVETLRKQAKQGDITGVKEIYDPKEFRELKQKYLTEAKGFVNDVYEKARSEKVISDEEYAKLKEEISDERKKMIEEINEARKMYSVNGTDAFDAGKELKDFEALLNKIKEQVIKDINFLYKNAKIENKAARSKINDFARREIINIRNSAAAEIEKKVNEITNREAEFLDEGYFTAKDLKHLKYPQELEGLMFDKVSFNAIDKFFERLKPSSIEDAVKGIKLFQATFDLFQMAEVARQRFGVTGFRGLVGYDWITNDKDFYDTAIKATERGLVLGKNEDIATDIIKRMGKPIVENETSWFGKNVINKLNDLSDKNKTTKAVKDMVMRLEDLQWKTVVPNTKLSMWRELSKKYKEIYAQYSVEEAETIAAETVNDFFQGINWDRLMAKDSTIGKFLNRNRIRMLRYAFFGPDRLAAVASRISKTFDGPNKAEYAKAHFRSIIMLLLLQNVLQYALSGHLSDENTKGSELDLEIPFIQDRKGNPIAVNIGGTAFEPLRFINKPYRFVMNKQGILPRVLGVGQKDYQRPKNVLEEIWQVATIPFAVQNIAEYALQDSDNPKTGDTDLPEAIVRAGAEFIGIPTTFRTGRNKEATIADLIKGDATLYQYVMSKDLKKTKKKL